MWKRMGIKKSGNKKFSWKKIWKKLRPSRRTEPAPKGDSHLVCENLPSSSHMAECVSSYADDMIDIHEVDKDRIRTSCKNTLENPPEFPSREEVKEKIESAHKYYGIKCMYNYYERSDETSDKKELQPSWYYILERPLVEQYVLMNNYIRKLSVQASLKKEMSGVQEEPAIEEEVSSISSLSDYEDFAPDSKIAAKLKELKKLGAKDSSPTQIGESRLQQELNELKLGAKGEQRIIKTNEYTIVIREPALPNDEHSTRNVVPSSSAMTELEVQGGEENKETDLNSSGDHLPDMKDFDLSYNLVDGPVLKRTGFGRPSYYHWQGNSTPTKTPLLNMDCQPPVRPRAAGTARDFLSFRNLSLSSEFVDSCRDYSIAFAEECRSTYLKELAEPGDSDSELDYGHTSSATQTEQKNGKPLLALTWEDTALNCRSAFPEGCISEMAGGNSIVERAALASDYYQECIDQGIDNAEDKIHGEESDLSEDRYNLEDTPSPHQLEDDKVLRTSVSQIDSRADFAESSASSLETQILASPMKLV